MLGALPDLHQPQDLQPDQVHRAHHHRDLRRPRLHLRLRPRRPAPDRPARGAAASSRSGAWCSTAPRSS
ncbi:MAG: hypothetical protein MZV64_09385 [Ignavibacteriales bacterium]|nr:hypothetical protein [Ignavibacteriales bacterium]